LFDCFKSRPAVIKNRDSVTIICSSTGGDPTPTVKWLRDNVVLDATSTTSGGVTVNEYTSYQNIKNKLLKTQIVYVPLGFGKQNLKLLIIYRY
jgi:hypothetical protein